MFWRGSTGWAAVAGATALVLGIGLARVSEDQRDHGSLAATVAPGPTAAPKAEAQPTEEVGAGRVGPGLGPAATAVARPRPAAEAGSAWLELDRYAARPGESLSLRAGGFWPGEPVRVSLQSGGQTVPLAELVADPAGELVAPALGLPPLESAGTALVLEGAQSELAVSRDVAVVSFQPWVVLEDYSLVPGGRLGLRGYGFQPGEPVRIWLDGATQPTHQVQADANGQLQLAEVLRVGPADVGQHSVTVTADESGARLDASYEVRPFVPVMTLARYAGPPGATVRFDGHGFAPGETVRVFAERGRQRELVAELRTDEQGGFEAAGAWRVPLTWTAGAVELEAVGEASQAPRRQTFDVIRQTAWASASPANGPSGTRVTVRGAGFGAGEEVEVLLGQQVLASAEADEAGAVGDVGPIDLRPAQSGQLQLVVRGRQSGAEAETTFTAEEAAANQ